MMRSPMGAPLFISFEGGEGAGKTTLIQQCGDFLEHEGIRVVKTREPGGTQLGDHIRHWLLDRDLNLDIGQKAELLLFLASRAQHIQELIEPSLKAGSCVLCDRFNDSTVVYQGIARGIGQKDVEKLCELICGTCIPSLTFFLDVDPEVGLLRSQRLHKENAKAGDADRIENESLVFHRQVREGFLKLARENPHRIHILDAHLTQKQVLEQAKQILKQWKHSHV